MLFALSDGSGVEIVGSTRDLQDLRKSIRTCESFCSIPLSVPAQFDDRGLRYLKELIIRVDADSLNVWEQNQQLFIAGAKQKLEVLSENVDYLLGSKANRPVPNRDHLHVEYYPGHFFLAEGALPLILVRQD